MTDRHFSSMSSRMFAGSPRVRAVPPEATARLVAKFEALRKRQQTERFWQRVQAMKQPENAR